MEVAPRLNSDFKLKQSRMYNSKLIIEKKKTFSVNSTFWYVV